MKDVVAIGRVSALYPERKTARVYREDKDIVTDELAVISQSTQCHCDQCRCDYWLPEIGEYVLCIFLPRGNSSGFIIGKF